MRGLDALGTAIGPLDLGTVFLEREAVLPAR